KNDGWQQAMELGNRTQQNVVVAPPARGSELLTYQAEQVGVQAQLTEARATSQASVLDGDPLPVDDPATPPLVFHGRRVKRGRDRAAGGRRLKAEAHGAYTSGRKGVANACGAGIAGVVVHPVRMTLANGPHGSHVHIA